MKIYFDKLIPTQIEKVAFKNDWVPFDEAPPGGTEGLLLTCEQSQLAIRDLSEPAWSPLSIDFLDPQWMLRLRKVQHETQLIKRAIGIKPTK